MGKWNKFTREIAKELQHDNFLSRPTISRTMHPRQDKGALAIRYMNYLEKKTPNCLKTFRWRDPAFGSPRIAVDGMSQSSIQTIWHFSNIPVNLLNLDHIVEVGGGYGNMCAVLKNAGHKGNYTIIDFPECHDLQRKYLENTVGIEKVEFREIDNLDDLRPALTVACYSLNEMPLEQRTLIEAVIDRSEVFYIQHNRAFDGIDNYAYFVEFIKRREHSITTYDDVNYPNHPVIIGR